jgi:hypothetical protein
MEHCDASRIAMNVLSPTVVGYVLERAIECVNGDWHFVYDAEPIGYAGLKVECICNEIGELLGEFYRVAGRTFFCPDLAIAAWNIANAYDVFDLCKKPEGAAAAEGRDDSDQLSRKAAADVGPTRIAA